MQLVERFWAFLVTIVNVITLSSLDSQINQNPLPLGLLDVATVAEENPVALQQAGPVFRPPGTPINSSFVCNYSSMIGWEECSTRDDRTCWLRRKSDGKRLDLFKNYEIEVPNGTTRYIDISLSNSTWDKDGKIAPYAKLFNNTYPGPWIQACWGDRIVVNVTNDLPCDSNLGGQGTSVHWHGIRQLQTMHMDGVNGVTQCPIAPGDYFVYNFTIMQYGSSWYHSHYSVQYADGAAGPMTLHGPSSANYDEAISPPLIMTDWGHNAAFDTLKTGDFEDFDILLNGLGDVKRFNESAEYDATPSPPYSITFENSPNGIPIKKYLLRLINTSFASAFVFSIDNHLLQVVSADFVPISPFMTKSIVVSIGQRYDIIVEADPRIDELNPGVTLPSDGNYWIRTNLSSCLTDTTFPAPAHYNETGILRYNASSTANPNSTQWKEIKDDCYEVDYARLSPIVQWNVGLPDNGITSSSAGGEDFGVDIDGTGDWALKQWRMGEPMAPSFRTDYQNITFLNLDNSAGWIPSWRIVEEEFSDKPGSWVWLVIENDTNFTLPHPIHLHGHDFAVLEQAYNKVFNPSNITINKRRNPPRRDVVMLPAAPGYVIIAFKADNPGAWLVHCHIAFHIATGLGMQIMEDRINATQIWKTGDSAALTEAGRVCENWGTWCHKQKTLFNRAPFLCEPLDSGV